ncbi:MAG: ROK family protein [Fibrobacter sp.]|nr:ROK family protein [Fibrobacter sp.]
MYSIGIDIGGTSIKGIISADNGYRSEIVRIPTEATYGGIRILDNIIRVIEHLMQRVDSSIKISGIGIGSPGFIDMDGTVLGGAGNLPGWEGIQIYTPLHQKFGIPVTASNDVTVMALAEYCYGAARGANNCVCIALGTGVGGGLIINGQIHGGTHGMAGEIGHISVDTNGRECNCGQRGCLEQYAAAPSIVAIAKAECEKEKNYHSTAFAKRVIDSPDSVTAKLVYEYVADGDPVACNVNEIICEKLARGIGIVANIIAPDRFVLGGGVMMSGDIIIDTVKRYVSRYCWRSIYERFDIRAAELGEDAGVLGAAALAMRGIQ